MMICLGVFSVFAELLLGCDCLAAIAPLFTISWDKPNRENPDAAAPQERRGGSIRFSNPDRKWF